MGLIWTITKYLSESGQYDEQFVYAMIRLVLRAIDQLSALTPEVLNNWSAVSLQALAACLRILEPLFSKSTKYV